VNLTKKYNHQSLSKYRREKVVTFNVQALQLKRKKNFLAVRLKNMQVSHGESRTLTVYGAVKESLFAKRISESCTYKDAAIVFCTSLNNDNP
jgi:hypothetical protein